MILEVEGAQLVEDQVVLDGCEQGLDDRRLEQAGFLPTLDSDLANRGRWTGLTGDGGPLRLVVDVVLGIVPDLCKSRHGSCR